MYCKKCGSQLKETDKFCSKCGYRLDGEEPIKVKKSKDKTDEELEDVDDGETSGSLSFLSMIVIFFGIIAICLLGVFIKKSMSDAELETSTEEKNQNAGTQFNNLGYQCGVKYTSYEAVERCDTGRITYADGMLYFYEHGGIYAVNEDREKTKICEADGASSLNMNGRKLYFLEGSHIYEVNVKKGEKEKLLSAESGMPFFMYGDIIYYISTDQVTATQKEFCILGYDVDKEEEVVHINTGSEQPRIVEVTEDGCITYYYQKSPEQSDESVSGTVICYELIQVDEDGDTIYSNEFQTRVSYFGAFFEFSAFRGDNSIYVARTCDQRFGINVVNPEKFLNRATVEAEIMGFQLKNSYKDDLIVYGWINGKAALYLVPEELLTSFDVNSPLIKEIVVESSTIVEVYVIGDYIYYTVEDDYWGGSDYDSDNLYRIKVDGTGWEDI